MSVDTLVLKLEEFEFNSPDQIDTTLYVFYDHSTSMYCIRGSRRGNYNDYSFTCSSQRDVSMFIEYVIGTQNKISYTLLNYGDLPFDSYLFDFDYLEDNYDIKYNEVVGFDGLKLKYNDHFLKNYLRMIRVVYNEYASV